LKEARKSGRRKTPGPQVLKRLSEIGDIRSAVSSLEFLCVRGDTEDGWGSKVAFTKPKKAIKDTPLTQMEQDSLMMVTQRESTLGIFHSVGKIVYNKRLSDPLSHHRISQPPPWFPEFHRPKASEVNIETLIDELGTDTQTFIAALHENYILSCEGSTSEETMDCVDGCIEALSDADLLSPDRFSTDTFGRRSFQGTSADNLRQDEMSFQASVRGLLFHLPSPVKRIAPPTGTMTNKGKGGSTKGSAFQMYYPASLRLWRQQEENAALLDMWISRAQNGELLALTSVKRKTVSAKPGSVESWRRSMPSSSQYRSAKPGSALSGSAQRQRRKGSPLSPESRDLQIQIVLGSGSSARHEMLLERLPYLTLILPQPQFGPTAVTSAVTIREIRKLTSFAGHGAAYTASEEQDEDDDEDTPGLVEQWSTDAPNTPRKWKMGRNKIEVKNDDVAAGLALPGFRDKDLESLVLSDDDIEMSE